MWRVVNWFKWALIVVGLFFAAIAAAPFLLLAYWLNEWETRYFINETAGALGRKAASDLR